jgi:peptide/nickel transport system ATP-binding protein
MAEEATAEPAGASREPVPRETVPGEDGAILSVAGLSVSYRNAPPGVHAVNDVSLSISPGEFVALIGESGSGKSTLSRAVAGLLPASASVTSGAIRVAGIEVADLPERQRSRIRGKLVGLVPQDPGASLDPVLTIGRQVTEIFRLHRDSEQLSRAEMHQRAADLLHLVGIDRPRERLRQHPHELSGGMRQRVLIAIAFGLQPRLLIADEPTSALDVTVQKQVLDIFDRLVSESGVSVLFITHNLAVAADRASRALVMRGGRIVDGGAIEDLVLRPAHAYTREMITKAFGSRPAPAQEATAREAAAREATTREAGEAPPAIEVSALTKRYRRAGQSREGFAAVDEVTFAVPQGTTFALVGESGSGKSTTARLILGLTRPSAGDVRVLGTDTTALNARSRRQIWRDIQLVYQNPQVALDPRYTVERVIEEPLRAFRTGSRGQRRSRITELLEHVGLDPVLAGRKPGQLSGGQQQRVAIARALATRSRVIILDEPLSALDVITQARILDLLARLQRELALTYLLISHDLDVVRSISQWVAVMRQGRIVEWGPTEQVFAEPRDAYTRQLIDSIPGTRFRDRVGRA